MDRKNQKQPVETTNGGSKTLPAPKPPKESKDVPAAQKPGAAEKE